jgi:hypothetical protein
MRDSTVSWSVSWKGGREVGAGRAQSGVVSLCQVRQVPLDGAGWELNCINILPQHLHCFLTAIILSLYTGGVHVRVSLGILSSEFLNFAAIVL